MTQQSARRLFDAASDLAAECEGSVPEFVPILRRFLTDLDQYFDLAAFRSAASSSKIQRLENQVRYQKRRRAEAETELKRQLAPKQGLRIESLWWLRTGLADPSIPAQSLSSFAAEFPVQERPDVTISRNSVSRSRDCFAEILKHMNKQSLVNVGHAMPLGDGTLSDQSKAIIFLHLHDEACMRVKSFSDFLTLSNSRSRSSAVQNQILQVFGPGDVMIDVLCELVALERKNAARIAKSLLDTSQSACEALLEGFLKESSQRRLRVVHIVVGDGAPTNESAVKRMWRAYSTFKPDVLRYKVLCLKCASHRANLCVQVAICKTLVRNPSKNNMLVGTCIRLFKYVLDSYHAEFVYSLRQYILSNLVVFSDRDQIPSDSRTAAYLQLYGQDVLPPSLIQVLNVCVSKLAHLREGQASRDECCALVAAELAKQLLPVHDKPTPTRFFLFSACVNTILRMLLLNLPPSVWMKLREVCPQKQNGKRMQQILTYFTLPETGADVRRAALCLRLTMHAVAITAQKPTSTDSVPPLVRMGQGEVKKKNSADLREIFPLLSLDPAIHLSQTVASLLTTACHLVMRFSLYESYPYKIWTLSKVYNPVTYRACVLEFLEEPRGHNNIYIYYNNNINNNNNKNNCLYNHWSVHSRPKHFKILLMVRMDDSQPFIDISPSFFPRNECVDDLPASPGLLQTF